MLGDLKDKRWFLFSEFLLISRRNRFKNRIIKCSRKKLYDLSFVCIKEYEFSLGKSSELGKL